MNELIAGLVTPGESAVRGTFPFLAGGHGDGIRKRLPGTAKLLLHAWWQEQSLVLPLGSLVAQLVDFAACHLQKQRVCQGALHERCRGAQESAYPLNTPGRHQMAALANLPVYD
jgi:hypothetical protein